jgi:hypothetical protein
MRLGMFLDVLTVTISGCLLLFSSSMGYASVIPPRIAQLAEESDVIVVAKVDSVSGRPDDGNRRAKATVTEVWKGPNVKTVEYRVSPTFACDVSDAQQGESVLLFLAKEEETGWGIVWAGRGRMPLRNINGKDYLTHFDDVIFPAKTPSVKTPEKRDDGFETAVELKIVKDLVRQAINQKK